MVSLRGERAYLDTNTVIYALEGMTQYTNLKAGLLDALEVGAFTAVTSELTLVETIIGPRKTGNKDGEAVFRTFLSTSANLLIEPITLAVLDKVIDLRATFGLKVPDAIHLATGILSGCTLFVTRDASWQRAGITVIQPQNIT